MRFSRVIEPIVPYLLLIIGSLSFTGCDQDNLVSNSRVQNLPAHFTLIGTAEGIDSQSQKAACSLILEFVINNETERTPFFVAYKGIHGGEVFRTVEQANGTGFEFAAGVFGEVDAHLITTTGVIDLVIPINATANGRFWKEMTHFEGVLNENGRGSGEWTCAPLDIDQQGYMDTSLIVKGTWQIEPIVP